MLDAHPAPAPRPRRPAAVSTPVSIASVDPQPAAPSKPAALLAAARTLLPVLESGRALDAPALRSAMTAAFGASDSQGGWVWKDAYEAAEAALVLFLQRYGRAMRREAGAGADGPAAMLRMLETLAALEPSQTRRSEEQLRLQQFSTPLPLAYAALQAAAIRPGDVVLEPSAGTGMLAVMAQCALGKKATASLHLNEIAATRAALLAGLFPGSTVTRHNAEAIRDHLPELRPTVVLMNPPFSASPGVDRIRHDADLRHIRSAFSMLPPGGRLVAISSSHCTPGDPAWADAFASLDPPARVAFTAPIDGRVYARRGTTFDTRLTVLDRGAERQGQVYAGARVTRRGPSAPGRRRHRAGPPAHPARAGRRSLRPCARRPAPHRPGVPAPPLRPLRRRHTTGAPSPGSPARPCRQHPTRTATRARRPRRPPVPTSPGGRAPSMFLAPSPTRRRWCSRAPWRRCRTPCRPTVRCCPSAWSARAGSPTPSSRASSSPARPTSATSPPSTASAPAGRRCSASMPRATTRTATMSRARTKCCRSRSASGAAGCSATAPAAARAGRSPRSSSTSG